jgi:pyruvate formate lyase activating enzyme
VTSGILFDIRKYSIHDGPGIRTAVFFKGCPLACAWCHNPESQSFRPELLLRPGRCIDCGACLTSCQPDAIHPSPSGVGVVTDRARCTACGKCTLVCVAEARQLVGQQYSVDQVMAEIEADRVFYERSGGGVTFTGGEPLAQPRFLLELLSACHTRGISTVLDTSGFAPWQVLDEIRPLVDLFLYDLKLMDESRHIHWTGISNADILSNLRQLSDAGSRILVRIPLIPGINDDEENLGAMGEFLASLSTPPPVELLPYHNIAEAKYAGLGRGYALAAIQSPDTAHIHKCAAIIAGYGIRVTP